MPAKAHTCGRCGAPAVYGFGAPYGVPDTWHVWACAAHRADAEAAWKRRFP